MRVKVNNKSGLVYIPDNLRSNGFVGDITVISNSGVMLFLNPSSTPEELRRSMINIMADLDAQIKRSTVHTG